MTADPADRPSPHQRTILVCLVLIALVAVGFALAQLGPVLVPFVMALLITYCLRPITEIQARYLRIPRPIATAVTIFLGFGVLLAIGFVATAGVTTMAGNLGPYRDHSQQLLQRLTEILPAETLGLEFEPDTGLFVIPDRATQAFLAALLGEMTFLLSNGALIFVFMLFLLIGTSRPPAQRPEFLLSIEARAQRYLLVLVALSASTGLLVGLTLHLLGVPFALLFGFLTFLLNFIPNIGSIIATLLPLPVILLEPGLEPHARILAFLLPAIIQFVIGNLLAPRLQGSALKLHPVTILLGIIFFGMIWGVAGALLATPLLAVAKITLERSPTTRPFAHLLAGNLTRLFTEQHVPSQETPSEAGAA